MLYVYFICIFFFKSKHSCTFNLRIPAVNNRSSDPNSFNHRIHCNSNQTNSAPMRYYTDFARSIWWNNPQQHFWSFVLSLELKMFIDLILPVNSWEYRAQLSLLRFFSSIDVLFFLFQLLGFLLVWFFFSFIDFQPILLFFFVCISFFFSFFFLSCLFFFLVIFWLVLFFEIIISLVSLFIILFSFFLFLYSFYFYG